MVNSIDTQVNQEISVNFDETNTNATLKIISSKVENGVATETTQVYEGTKDEIMDKLDELKMEGKILKIPTSSNQEN